VTSCSGAARARWRTWKSADLEVTVRLSRAIREAIGVPGGCTLSELPQTTLEAAALITAAYAEDLAGEIRRRAYHPREDETP